VKHCGGSLPDAYDTRLIEMRKHRTHEGKPITREMAEDAIAVATTIVERAPPLPDRKGSAGGDCGS